MTLASVFYSQYEINSQNFFELPGSTVEAFRSLLSKPARLGMENGRRYFDTNQNRP